jgi:RimJ/RimL family protein N-acetyltransferase
MSATREVGAIAPVTNLFLDQIATPRMLGERLSLTHFAKIHQLYTDPLVMKTLSADGRVASEDSTRKHLQMCVEHWQEHGYGIWAFHRKADGQFIGRGGLKTYEIDGEKIVGLAYAVLSDYWGQGFATEMAEASVKIGFEKLHLPEIASWTLPINRASQRVMEKIGFHYERDFQFAGLPHRFYRLLATDWAEQFSRLK